MSQRFILLQQFLLFKIVHLNYCSIIIFIKRIENSRNLTLLFKIFFIRNLQTSKDNIATVK